MEAKGSANGTHIKCPFYKANAAADFLSLTVSQETSDLFAHLISGNSIKDIKFFRRDKRQD